MAARSGMTVLARPKLSPDKQFKVIRNSVKKRITPVANLHVAARNKVTANWKPANKPTFRAVVSMDRKQIRIQVEMTNRNKSLGKYGKTVGDLWGWINKGTRPHRIVPRFARVLSWIGTSGKRIFSKVVWHPGTKGQRQDERINRTLQKKLDAAINAGFKEGLKLSTK